MTAPVPRSTIEDAMNTSGTVFKYFGKTKASSGNRLSLPNI